MKKYSVKCGEVGLYVMLLLTLMMGSQYIMAYVFQVIGGSAFDAEHMYLRTLMAYGLIVIGIGLMNHIEKQSIRETYKGFTKQQAWKGLCYAVPMWLIVGLINAIMLPFFPQYEAEVNTLFQSNELILRFVVLVIGAPVLEEYLFREKMLQFTKKRFGKNIAIVFQGIVFGLIHPFGLQKIYASALGIGLGFIKEKTGHIMAPTMIHMLVNGIGFLAGLKT